MKKIVWIIGGLAVLVGVVLLIWWAVQPRTLRDETALIGAADGLQLSVRVVEPVEEPKAILVMAHSLGGSKADWNEMIDYAVQQGYAAVAFDFRGNGDSQGNIKSFTEEDFQLFPSDVSTVINYTAGKFKGSNTPMILVGSSIGANAVMKVMENAKSSGDLKGMILLSPGLEYRGLSVAEVGIPQDIPTLMIASQEDEYAYSSCVELSKRFPPGQLEFVQLEKAGHGAAMMKQSPHLTQRMFNWLDNLSL